MDDDSRLNPNRSQRHHSTKQQLIGNRPGRAPPAWKANAVDASGQPNGSAGKLRMPVESGSKIFISMLPVDVAEKDVEDLFRITVGPLKEAFLVYNSQGKSKGMAVVSFQRPGDAAIARTKYNAKVIDGRRPIKIDIISDGVQTTPTAPKPALPSLLNRLSPISQPLQHQQPVFSSVNGQSNLQPPSGPRQLRRAIPKRPAQQAAAKPIPIPPRKLKQKKGPKRLKKREVTVDDLDKEMEDYRAAAPEFDDV